jgi:preprotein translocase subunit SecG
MYNFLVILLLLDALVLGAAILLQAGKGGGLAASFGGAGSSPNSLLGSREAGNILTKTSWWAGAIFLTLAFVLQIMSARGRGVRSVLDDQFGAPPAAPTAPATSPTSVPLQSAPPPAGDTSKQP